LVLGVFFHRFIIVTAEVEYVMFGRIVKPLSFVYAGILTMVFSLLVNIVIHFKLKKIDMVESLKSVD
jgi:putative ABC transport system permease protein